MIRHMGSKGSSTATFAFPEGDVRANHPKEVQREKDDILSVLRQKVNCRAREAAQKDTRQRGPTRTLTQAHNCSHLNHRIIGRSLM